MEIWKPHHNFRFTECSNLGRIRTTYFKSRGIDKDPIRKSQISNSLYHMIIVTTNEGVIKNCLVHRLIAEVFVPNPHNLSDVHHKDENKSNNKAENLEWTCRQDHIVNHQGKKIIGFNRITKEVKEFKSQTLAAQYIGGNHQNISTSKNKGLAVKDWYFFTDYHLYQSFLESNPDLR